MARVVVALQQKTWSIDWHGSIMELCSTESNVLSFYCLVCSVKFSWVFIIVFYPFSNTPALPRLPSVVGYQISCLQQSFVFSVLLCRAIFCFKLQKLSGKFHQLYKKDFVLSLWLWTGYRRVHQAVISRRFTSAIETCIFPPLCFIPSLQ